MEEDEKPKASKSNSINFLKFPFSLKNAMPLSLYPPGGLMAAVKLRLAMIVNITKKTWGNFSKYINIYV